MSDLMAKAKELGEDLARTPEYQALEAARADVEGRVASKLMFDDFTKMRSDLESKQAKGQPIPEAQMKAFESAGNLLMKHEPTADLMMATYTFTRLMHEVQQTLAREVGIDIPDMPGPGEAE